MAWLSFIELDKAVVHVIRLTSFLDYGFSVSAQVKRDGLAITVERRGTSSGIALRHLSRPQLHVQSAKALPPFGTLADGASVLGPINHEPEGHKPTSHPWNTAPYLPLIRTVSQVQLQVRHLRS